MTANTLSLETLWNQVDFRPNDNQRAAIRHIDGPLYLPAGPGSGKTRVLLWHTVNLIVFHGIKPEEIYLSTFTEKAAHQLREGLRGLLGVVTACTGVPYDLSGMYVGTVHSLCQRLIMDRRFYPSRQRGDIPALLDELGQYFYLYKTRMWNQLTEAADLTDNATINSLFEATSSSKHVAVTNCIKLFNRLSEERIDPAQVAHLVEDNLFRSVLEMYDEYKRSLLDDGPARRTDFSLLQQEAMQRLDQYDGAGSIFQHVIIDEYQDTNTIQESIFFRLAQGRRNICVVGDDDQALYRFRGATVENFVQFPQRCQARLAISPTTIPLDINYRSRKWIVDFYTDFISRCDWSKAGSPTECYRVTEKDIRAHRTDAETSVVASTPAGPLDVCREIADLVFRIINEGKVENPNQIAFLYPSLKYRGKMNEQVKRMKDALEARGLLVYAPRAGRFLEVEEAVDIFGLFLHVFGKPARAQLPGQEYADFHAWLDGAHARAGDLIQADPQLKQFVRDRREEIQTALRDLDALQEVVRRHNWTLAEPYYIDRMKRPLHGAPGLSTQAKRSLTSAYFEHIVRNRLQEDRPFTLGYVIRRATSFDWTVLDLFYRLCGFGHFKAMFDLAERDSDEGPICNLALISQYLARFMEEYVSILTADILTGDKFVRLFASSFLFALFRLGESEYEDAEDPFPRGRIPFLTIHQAKGLEFPVVVLGNPRKNDRGPQIVERLVNPLIDREGEPLERSSEFDIMRMFYVALSRAKNLLVIAHFKGRGQSIYEPFKQMLDDHFPRIPDFDIRTLPLAAEDDEELPKNYSYTSDYSLYERCPRQYMVYRKYGFVPSRSQTMMFGSLVHQTLDDLHQYLIDQRSQT